eukprot:c13889_g1_i1.p1 GENE.c13889_g1_i1~~c13889_g1_i1.p1  ORF type:complete len:272 (-),score=122.71 c13889_g1_i1:51-866(-)
MKGMIFVSLFLSLVVCVFSFQLSDGVMNEFSKFSASDEFYEKMDSFLETGTSESGGFQFKCVTSCQLVQKNALVSGSGSPLAHSLLQTEEGSDTQKLIESAFYEKMTEFLETQSKTTDAGGDFEFKCDTSCQLVEQNTVPINNTTPSTPSTPKASSAASNHAAHNFLQTEAGSSLEQKLGAQTQLQVEAQAEAQAQAQPTAQVKDCYRLCLNPSMNPGCDVASNAVSLLETGETTELEVMRKNWSLGSGSGNCLNSCVHVCMAVHENIAHQ